MCSRIPAPVNLRKTAGLWGGPIGKDPCVPKWIDRAEVRRLVAADAQLVEVLPRDEFEHEHLPAARSIPLKELDVRARSELELDRTVIVYCYGFL
jgi:rhodanese-related sulfurtransferase